MKQAIATSTNAARRQRAFTRVNQIKQAGVTLTEMLVSVVVMVAVVGFVYFMKSQVYGPLLGWMEASTVSTHISKIENVYAGAANYTGLTTASMATPSIVQNKYLPGGGVINNRFNGTVTLGIVTINSPNDALTYTDGNVRSDSCTTLVNQLSDDADRITVAGTIVKPLNGVVNPGTLKTQCDSANNVSIMFERMKRA
ncbi:type 4 pilus major pilin [Massilia sp. X63]|uniref:type 4 pilus major pilin n=1 Tax=Massilia sp. X63 TaxID=3237285 RepID=UPI0034DD27B2